MPSLRAGLALSLVCLLAGCATGAVPARCPTVAAPGEPAWQEHPTAAGVRVQYLVGSPREPGYFAYRLFFPAGFTLAPHAHTAALHSTLLCGELIVGRGPVADGAAEYRVTRGGFGVFPAGEAHWERVETDSVLLVTGVGPVSTVPVSPSR